MSPTPRTHARRPVRRRVAPLVLVGAVCLGLAAQGAAAPAAKLVAKDPNSNRTMWLSSTFTTGTFALKNDSDQESITRFEIDLADGPALFPRMAWDPDIGLPAGDAKPKSFTQDSGPGITTTAAYDKVIGNGFSLLAVDASGFTAGKTLTFSIDVDPITTQGGPETPAPPAAHVSAAELHGATLRVFFSDGSQHTSDLSLIPGQASGKQRDSQAYVAPGAPAAPGLVRAAGYPSPSTTPQAPQSVVVSRPPGAPGGALSGRVVVAEGHFDRSGVPGTAPAQLPYEANTVRVFREYPFTIPAGAPAATVAIALSRTAHVPDPGYPDDSPEILGLNYITAFLVIGGEPRSVSDPLVLEYDPSASVEPVPPPPPGGGAGGGGVVPTPIPPALAPSPSPICATGRAVATGSGSSGGRVTLTDRQLLINQRISQAAVRRLNAVQAWLDARVAARDICGGSIGADRLAPGIGIGLGAQVAGARSNPRPVGVKGRSGRGGTVTVTLRQLRINDRIARAALQRAQAIERRLDAGLTGGDLRAGAVGPAQLAPGLAVTSSPPGSASAPRTRTVLTGSINSGRVRFEASQLLRTQRVSQQAIRITNGITVRLSRGLRGADFRAGSIGSPALTP